MASDQELLEKAIKHCVAGVTRPEQLQLIVGANDKQWATVWRLFMLAGGRTGVQGTSIVITVCPVASNADEKTLAKSRSLIVAVKTASSSAGVKRKAWPKTSPERFGEVHIVLQEQSKASTVAEIKARFATRTGEKRFKEMLDTLVILGLATKKRSKYQHHTLA